MNEETESGADTHPHVPVMVSESMQYLDVRSSGTYVDCTAGYGGHAECIADRLSAGGRLIAIDRDEIAVDYVARRLSRYGETVTVVRSDFADLARVLDDAGIEHADGILFDLGASVPQLRDDSGRGFSVTSGAPLDMRMDDRQTLTAAEIVNRWPESELARIFYEYSDERYSRAIAREIVRRRQNKLFSTANELADVVVDVVKRRRPAGGRRRKLHPATRVFQAVRMAVNDEIGALRRGLDAAADALSPGGRLCVISFHSVEHREVKTFMRERARPCTCPPGVPECVCGAREDMVVLTRRSVKPSDDEIAANPHARSAQLRVGEKVKNAT